MRHRRKNPWALWRPIYKYSWAVWQKESYKHYAQVVNNIEDGVILDIGTGTGEYIKYIKSNNRLKFIFTDPDNKSLELAKIRAHRQGLNCEFVVGYADEVLEKVSFCTHLSLIHVLSVIDEPFDFIESAKKNYKNAKIYVYLSRFSAKSGLTMSRTRVGFRRLEKNKLIKYFQVEKISALINLYKS
jgi:ubiquinone/menaquinone biosynthesis C-methylase UbiE